MVADTASAKSTVHCGCGVDGDCLGIRSLDRETWEEVTGLNDHPDFFQWRGGDKDGTPDGSKLHSVIVDHSDAKHLLIGMSGGGIFESFDEGESWQPLNKGVAMDFYPPKDDGSEYNFGHDPHCVVMLHVVIPLTPAFCIPRHCVPRNRTLGSAYCSWWHPQLHNTLCSLPAQDDTRGSARLGLLPQHSMPSIACTTPASHTQHPHHHRLEQCLANGTVA